MHERSGRGIVHAVKRAHAHTHTHTPFPVFYLPSNGNMAKRRERVERATRPEFTGVYAIELSYVYPLL